MFKQVTKKIGAGLLLAAGVTTVQAEVINQMNSNGDFASAYQGSTGFTLTVEGDGVNQSAVLMVNSYSSDTGFTSWKGELRASDFTMSGVSSVTVTVDTCEIDYVAGCGYVDATVTKDALDGGWVINGSSSTSYGDLTEIVAGVRQVHRADAEGTVNGVTLGQYARSFIGKDSNVTITISTP